MHKTFWLAAVAAMLWFGPAGASADLIAEINIKDGQLTFINETGGTLELTAYQISLSDSDPVAKPTWNTSEWLPLSGDQTGGDSAMLAEFQVAPFWSVSNGVSASLGTPFEYQNFDDLGSDDFSFIGIDDAGPITTSVRLVPEPASLALIGIGGLVLLRRRPAA